MIAKCQPCCSGFCMRIPHSLVIVVSSKDFLPIQHQAFTWANAYPMRIPQSCTTPSIWYIHLLWELILLLLCVLPGPGVWQDPQAVHVQHGRGRSDDGAGHEPHGHRYTSSVPLLLLHPLHLVAAVLCEYIISPSCSEIFGGNMKESEPCV